MRTSHVNTIGYDTSLNGKKQKRKKKKKINPGKLYCHEYIKMLERDNS
jgi:hypothetical protein